MSRMMAVHTRARHLVLALGVLAGAAGCSTWAPPKPTETTPEFATLRAHVGEAIPLRLVVTSEEAPTASALPDRAATVAADARLQRDRVAAAVRALGLFREVSAGDAMADADAGTYRLHLRLRESDVRYLGMNGKWIANFALWSCIGPLSWMVADEDFAGHVTWEVSCLPFGDRRPLAETRVDRLETVPLDDIARGWSLWDLLIFGAAPIDADRLARAGRCTQPYAEAAATMGVCDWLVNEVAPKLREVAASAPGPGPDQPPVPLAPPPPPILDPPVALPTVVRPPAAPPSRGRVLAIGVEATADGGAAPHAAADARAVADACIARGIADAADVTVLHGPEATRAAIQAWLAARAAEPLTTRDRVWIFFAGRGATDAAGEPYLLPTDGDASAADTTGVALREIGRACKDAGRVTFLLDCAFQGRRSMRGPGQTRAPRPAAEVFGTGSTVRALAAAYGTGEAATSARVTLGLFTAALVRELREGGGATLDETAGRLAAGVTPEARRRGVREVPARLAGPAEAAFVEATR